MENLTRWYRFAVEMSEDSEGLQKKLLKTERAIQKIEVSIQESKKAIEKWGEKDFEEKLSSHNSYLDIMFRLLNKLISSMIHTSVLHCLQSLQDLNLDSKTGNMGRLIELKEPIWEIYMFLKSKDKHLGKLKEQLLEESRVAVNLLRDCQIPLSLSNLKQQIAF